MFSDPLTTPHQCSISMGRRAFRDIKCKGFTLTSFHCRSLESARRISDVMMTVQPAYADRLSGVCMDGHLFLARCLG